MPRDVKLRVPDGVSDADLKEMMMKGVPPELTALLDSVRGILGSLEQAVRTMAESTRLSSERQARAIVESSPTIDTSSVETSLTQLAQQVTKSNKDVIKSVDRISTVIASAVQSIPKGKDNTQAIVDSLSPLVSKTEGPRSFHIDIHRDSDQFMTSVDGVTRPVSH